MRRSAITALAGASVALAATGWASAYTYSGGGSVSYTEGGASVLTAPSLTLAPRSGGGSGLASQASVTISAGRQPGDMLTVAVTGPISGTYNSATGVLSLVTEIPLDTTRSNWQDAFVTVRFSTTDPGSGGPGPAGTRTLTYATTNSFSQSGTSTVVVSTALPSVPAAPTAVAGDAGATITAATGAGGFAPTSHLITSMPGGLTCTVTGATGSCTISGLTTGTPYRFTDTAIRYDVSSSASAASAQVTPGMPDVPAAPTAVAGNAQATVTVAAGAGGVAPTSHLITSVPGGLTCTVTGATGSCTITGLTNGTPYTFIDTAARSGVSSAASGPSAQITPGAAAASPALVTPSPATSPRQPSSRVLGTRFTRATRGRHRGRTRLVARVQLDDSGTYTFILFQRSGTRRLHWHSQSAVATRMLPRGSSAPSLVNDRPGRRVVLTMYLSPRKVPLVGGQVRIQVVRRAADGSLVDDVFTARTTATRGRAGEGKGDGG